METNRHSADLRTHFQLGRSARVHTRNTILRWVDSVRATGKTLQKNHLTAKDRWYACKSLRNKAVGSPLASTISCSRICCFGALLFRIQEQQCSNHYICSLHWNVGKFPSTTAERACCWCRWHLVSTRWGHCAHRTENNALPEEAVS